ncbi:MAG TPA: DNA repair protein RadC, partial [Caulobacteraceae bacterium]
MQQTFDFPDDPQAATAEPARVIDFPGRGALGPITAAPDRPLLGELVGGAAATALFARFGGLAEIFGADGPEVRRLAGEAAARQLAIIHELMVRAARNQAKRRPVISSWSALLAYVRVAMAQEAREQFRVFFLDKKNQLIADEVMNIGTVDHAPVYPREVVRRALETSASAIILCHNHPSGDPTPSSADIDMTRQVVEACRPLRISVHDHLVVGRDGVASFKA